MRRATRVTAEGPLRFRKRLVRAALDHSEPVAVGELDVQQDQVGLE
jgi:hypothetical protein